MWFERFVITVTSLANEFTTSAWDYYSPKLADVMILLGAFGLFFTLFALFCRFLPFIAMSEVRGVLAEQAQAKARAQQQPSPESAAKPAAES
jgi:molybdopterin-containing oxidoreductase family membrane subunit